MDTDQPINYFYNRGMVLFSLFLSIAFIGICLWACISIPFLWAIIGFWGLPIGGYLVMRGLRMLRKSSVPVISITRENISINDGSLKTVSFGDITLAEIKPVGDLRNPCLLIKAEAHGNPTSIILGLNPIDAKPSELLLLIKSRAAYRHENGQLS